MGSFTLVDRDRLRRCIDDYIDCNVNKSINKKIKEAQEDRNRIVKRLFRKPKVLTLDESFDKCCFDKYENFNWLNYRIRCIHEKMEVFEALLLSNNDIYICADDAYILTYGN